MNVHFMCASNRGRDGEHNVEACVGGDIFYCCHKLCWFPRETDENHTIANTVLYSVLTICYKKSNVLVADLQYLLNCKAIYLKRNTDALFMLLFKNMKGSQNFIKVPELYRFEATICREQMDFFGRLFSYSVWD